MKTKSKWRLLIAIIGFLIISCEKGAAGDASGDSQRISFTLTFDADNGTAETIQNIVKGGKAIKPTPDPSKDGFHFVHWFNIDNDTEWNFDTVITGNMRLKAKWVELFHMSFDPQTAVWADSADNKLKVIRGNTLHESQIPALREFYAFVGWFTHPTGGRPFDFATPITADTTLYAQWKYIRTLDGVETHLAAQSAGDEEDKPVALPVKIQLSEENWTSLLQAIDNSKKYLSLDLSHVDSSESDTGGGLRSDGAFDPISGMQTGKAFIVSLVLPLKTESIVDAVWENFTTTPVFRYFINLKSIEAENCKNIGIAAFAVWDTNGNSRLNSLYFPQVTHIGFWAFINCENLENINFPKLSHIGQAAFQNCTNLSDIRFPELSDMEIEVFNGCSKLRSVHLPKLNTITQDAFAGCTSLADLYFPVATHIEYGAFQLSGLAHASFPEVTTIDHNAFASTKLTQASFPKATSIGNNVFELTGTAPLTLILGSNAPTLGADIFSEVISPKTVRVRIPTDASGYGSSPVNTTDENWGNGLRGCGWDGSAFALDDCVLVNSNINLSIEHF
ncbi:MAG: leucine-rich repeat protein [Cystobacterineae bacterium]|nr:leucine-rich repeat protein [Cystobacterineae bacterium]